MVIQFGSLFDSCSLAAGVQEGPSNWPLMDRKMSEVQSCAKVELALAGQNNVLQTTLLQWSARF
jgi:hypothetical protein